MKIELDQPISLREGGVWLSAGLAGFLIAMHLDRWVYLAFADLDPRPLVEWKRMLRMVGYIPVWLIVAAATFLIRTAKIKRVGLKAAARPAVLLVVCVVGSAFLSEAIKIVVRRQRPYLTGGAYLFRPWHDRPWQAQGLGLPSSHASIGFAAAWILILLYPRAAPVWVGLSVACAAARVITTSHFLSDVVVSAPVSYAVVRLIWQWDWHRRRRSAAALRPAPGGG